MATYTRYSVVRAEWTIATDWNEDRGLAVPDDAPICITGYLGAAEEGTSAGGNTLCPTKSLEDNADGVLHVHDRRGTHAIGRHTGRCWLAYRTGGQGLWADLPGMRSERDNPRYVLASWLRSRLFGTADNLPFSANRAAQYGLICPPARPNGSV